MSILTLKKLIVSLFIIICIISCKTVNPIHNAVWDIPIKPVISPVHFVQKDGGLYINEISSANLLKNVDSMNAYTEKLEVLIQEMKKYYGAK